jgi:hypothetical protein
MNISLPFIAFYSNTIIVVLQERERMPLYIRSGSPDRHISYMTYPPPRDDHVPPTRLLH